MTKWILAFLLVGAIWFALQKYLTEQRIKESLPVRYTHTLQRQEEKAQESADKSQTALQERMKEYSKSE